MQAKKIVGQVVRDSARVVGLRSFPRIVSWHRSEQVRGECGPKFYLSPLITADTEDVDAPMDASEEMS